MGSIYVFLASLESTAVARALNQCFHADFNVNVHPHLWTYGIRGSLRLLLYHVSKLRPWGPPQSLTIVF